MNNLLPDISDALTVHDAAHREQSAELHDVALKMLSLCDQVHICTDALDEQADKSVLDGLPGAVCVDTEAVALFGEKMVVADAGSEQAMSGHFKGKVVGDQSFKYKPRTPAYELWLVKKAEAEKVVPDCAYTVGKFVSVGKPRTGGAYRFPVVCQRVPDGYQMLQVHKDGEKVTVFDRDGRKPAGLADLIDAFVGMDSPEQCIVECIYHNGQVQMWDCLMLDGVDCAKLPYRERDKMLSEALEKNDVLPDNVVACEQQVISQQEQLPMLESGLWLIRYEHEVLSGITRSFWFERRAGELVPGIVMPWVVPQKQIGDSSGYITVKDTGLPPVQLHKGNGGVSVFVGHGGRNRAKQLPQIVAAAENLPEDTIIEAMVDISDNGIPVSVDRMQNPKQDLSGCQVTLLPYDIILWGDENLSAQPMYERTELLEQIVGQYMDCELGLVDNGGICFEADSVRPLNGSSDHCYLKS